MHLLPEPPATFRRLLRLDQEDPATAHDPEAWLLEAERSAVRCAGSLGLDVLGFPDLTNRSFVVALGADSHIHAIYKAPYPNSKTVTPGTAVSALVAWGQRGLAPLSRAVGDAVVSEYVAGGTYFGGGPRTIDQYADLLSVDLDFPGQPQALEQRTQQRRQLVRGRRQMVLQNRPDLGDEELAALDSAVADVDASCDYLLDHHGSAITICHGDHASVNILKGPAGQPLLIGPEPHYGPREVDLARLLSDDDAALGDADISRLCRQLGFDEQAVRLEMAAVRAHRSVLHMFRESTRAQSHP